MKKKYIIITISIIITIAIIILGFILYKSQSDKKRNNDKIPSGEENTVVDEFGLDAKDITNPTYDIKDVKQNNSDNSKNSEISVEEMKILKQNSEIKVITILKNNSNKDIKGYYISLELLDDKGNRVTTISDNSDETIPANGTLNIINYASISEDMQNITDARVLKIEKNMDDELTDAFETIEDLVDDEE